MVGVRLCAAAQWSLCSEERWQSEPSSRQDLAEMLEKPYTHPHLYFACRFAINQADPVARFMFLYNILLLPNGDSQKEVDAFIRSESPEVPQSLSARPDLKEKGVMETIYTRLRNEVAHVRNGTTPDKTREELQDNLPAFQELVRTAISLEVT